MTFPSEAKVVIVGGGVVGCSVAYHLAKLGWKNIVLLEQNTLAGGTTWHAAGLVGQLRTSNSLTKINKYSVELYQKLEAETGHATGWNEVGSLIVARSEARMTQLRRTAAMAELFGVHAEIISPKAAGEKWPYMRTEDLLGAVWLPHDGKVIPKEVALALAKGATQQGVTLVEGVLVQNVEVHLGRAVGVLTNRGKITAEYIVLCGGMWTRELGLQCGVTIPLSPVEHHYVVSAPIEGCSDNLPVGRDPDVQIYFRSEAGGIMLGAFQKYSTPWMVERIPEKFSYQLLEPDWEKFAEPLAAGKWRLPILETTPLPKFVNGPESFTPDNNFIMGEAPEIKNLYVAAGFNSVGIASAGGAGKYLAEWMSEGSPSTDLWSVDIRRFMPFHNQQDFLRERVTEVLGLHYLMAWPNREMETGRNLRKSPIHDQLAAQGACFGSRMGYERPLFFAREGEKPELEYSFEKQNWFAASAAEHQATREKVALFDQTAFSKYLFQGKDVLPLLQTLCGNDIDVPIGNAVYTGMFNERGTFESDLTVVRVATDTFYIITSSAQTVRDFDWISRHIPEGADAVLTDVTADYSVLGLMGPHSRQLLQRLTKTDLSHEAFPFGTSQTLRILKTELSFRAIRITYVGELGWELHVPTEMCAAVYAKLQEVGKRFGLTNAGHYALNSLRLEKAYRAWGSEISPDDTPFEAGLSFALAWNKSVPFLGREALLEKKLAPLTRRLVTFVLQAPEAMLWGSEPILRNGKPVGYTTSGAYGHTVGGAVGMGYVKNPEGVSTEFIRSGHFEIEVDGKRIPATTHLRAPYDPDRRSLFRQD